MNKNIVPKEIFRSTFDLQIPFKTRVSLGSDLFNGKKAFIFAAGPSLSSVDIERLKPELEDNLVICIKQSINLVGDVCDLLLMNFCNFNDYNWDSIDCPVVWTSFDDNHSKIIKERGIKCNELLPVVENSKNDFVGLSSSTAGKKCWENMLRLSEEKAIWGPGLMYELAIPFALNSGVNHICLVGWDIGTIRENGGEAFLNEHFYSNSNVEMKTKISDLEIKIVSESTRDLQKWLLGRGVSMSVVSNASAVDNSVQRENKWLKEKA